MLDVVYEAVTDLEPGRLAKIDEDRGTIRVSVDKHEPLADVVRQLNIEIDQLLSASHWFQLWGTEIVSRDTPGRPLRVEYVFRPWVQRDVGVLVGEDRGIVCVRICPQLNTEEFAAYMTKVSRDLLAGGHWFQLYAGEIVDNGPEPMSKV